MSTTVAHSDELGLAWVGPGFSRSISNPDILISSDGLKQYRPASYKPDLGIYQANLEWRNISSGKWPNNGHINITDLNQ